MKKIYFYALLSFLNITIAAMQTEITHILTFSTFLSNAWTGDSTFVANNNLPIIKKGKKQFIVQAPGKLKKVKLRCWVDEKETFEINGFFKTWSENLKEKFEEEKIQKAEKEMSKIDLINTFCAKEFIIDESNDEIIEETNKTIIDEQNSLLGRKTIQKRVVVDTENNPLKCGTCLEETFSKEEMTYYECCVTEDSVKFTCKACLLKIESLTKQCPFCRKPTSSVDRSLHGFNNAFFINNPIPYYILDKSTNIVSEIDVNNHKHDFNSFAKPNDNRVAVTKFIKAGSPFQIKYKSLTNLYGLLHSERIITLVALIYLAVRFPLIKIEKTHFNIN